MNKTLVVLAAGMGSRYGGLKQLDPIGPSGETIIDYSLYDAINAGFEDIVFIIRESFHKEFHRNIGSRVESRASVSYVFQTLNNLPDDYTSPETREKPWGTGHALYCAIANIDNPFLIINGDDFYGTDAFRKAADSLDEHIPGELLAGMIGYSLENTLSENGTVSRGICSVRADNCLTSVVETHEIEKIQGTAEIQSGNGPLADNAIASMNLWYFSPAVFPHVGQYFEEFLKLNINSPKAEYYLPAIVNNLISRENQKVEVQRTASKWFGVTYKEDKQTVIHAILSMIDEGLYPENLWENQ